LFSGLWHFGCYGMKLRKKWSEIWHFAVLGLWLQLFCWHGRYGMISLMEEDHYVYVPGYNLFSRKTETQTPSATTASAIWFSCSLLFDTNKVSS
jgi:hypothetical protein